MDESLKLVRHHLGAINLSDVEDKDQTPAERKDYCAAICAVFPRLERDIKKFMASQVLWGAKEAANMEQILFGRGVLDGMAMLLEHWSQASNEHLHANEKEFDKHNPLSEI